VNREPQWAVSPLDTMTHLLPPLGDQPCWGVYRALPWAPAALPRRAPRAATSPASLPRMRGEVSDRSAPYPLQDRHRADAAAPGPLSVTGTREVDGDAEVPALGCAARAVAGMEASAGTAAKDATGAGPAHAAALCSRCRRSQRPHDTGVAMTWCAHYT